MQATVLRVSEEDKVADEVTSQAKFLGGLAIALIAFAIIVAAVLAVAGMRGAPM